MDRTATEEFPCAAITEDHILTASGTNMSVQDRMTDAVLKRIRLGASTRRAACGLVLNVDGTAKSFVMVGGAQGTFSGYQTTIMIYDVKSESVTVRSLGVAGGIAHAATASYGRSFLLFGGGNPTIYLDTIYKFDENTNALVLLEKKLSFGTWRMAVVRVKSNLFCKAGTHFNLIGEKAIG